MYLKPGDTIGIVSPARAISEAELRPAIQWFERNGLQVVLGQNALRKHHQMAGTDQEKIADIQAFINNPTIKAIVCARGGYGSVRIIDQVDLSPLKTHFKWWVGYSDMTVFHSHIHRQLNLPSLHATMPVNISANPSAPEHQSNQSLLDALFGKDLVYELPKHPFNRPGRVNAPIVGGNLSILYSLCGSASDIDTEGKILFIEDLDEYLYHIDRMMMNLKRTGKLDRLAGLVVGSMSDMNDNTIPYGKTAEEIIKEHTHDQNYPVYFGFDAGHQKPNFAIRFGMDAVIENNQLTLLA